jgi:sensor c-di-GMP phosphodiesterase-like protein
MALALGLTITAEGAETAEQAAYLRNKGCHILQGWHYSKSLSFSEYLEFLSSRV